MLFTAMLSDKHDAFFSSDFLCVKLVKLRFAFRLGKLNGKLK